MAKRNTKKDVQTVERLFNKLPRGHAYIHMRNRGYSIDLDYRELDSEEAELAIKAVMSIVAQHCAVKS